MAKKPLSLSDILHVIFCIMDIDTFKYVKKSIYKLLQRVGLCTLRRCDCLNINRNTCMAIDGMSNNIQGLFSVSFPL